MPGPAARSARVVRPRIGPWERLVRIWAYRELLVGMVRKELKVKYKNSVLGFAWSLLNPLLYLVVFYVAFQVVLRSNITAFPIYLLSGLLVWNLFSVGLGGATGSIVANSGLVKKVAFPREILPIASVGSGLVNFFLQGSVLVAVLAIVRWNVGWAYVSLIPVALLAVLFLACGLGIMLSAINVYLRDTAHFLELALLAWFWTTPIVYAFMLIKHHGGWTARLFQLNPVTPVVLVFQRAIYARLTSPGNSGSALKTSTDILPTWGVAHYATYLGYSLGVGVVVLVLGVWLFGRIEANFAQEL
jgi:ABC-2 type transport system permease protein